MKCKITFIKAFGRFNGQNEGPESLLEQISPGWAVNAGADHF